MKEVDDSKKHTVAFKPLDRERRMPLLLSFVLIGFFIWLAKNISTFSAFGNIQIKWTHAFEVERLLSIIAMENF